MNATFGAQTVSDKPQVSFRHDLRRLAPVLAIVLGTAVTVAFGMRAISARFLENAILASPDGCEHAALYVESARLKLEDLRPRVAELRMEARDLTAASLGQLPETPGTRKAREDLERALELCTISKNAHYSLSLLEWYTGNEAKAWYHLARLQQLDQEPDKAYVTLEMALQADPEFLPAIVAQARSLRLLGRSNEAWALLEDRQEKLLDDAGGLEMLGVLQAQRGQREEALENLEKALRLNPTNVAAAREYTNLVRATGNPQAGANFLMELGLNAPRTVADVFHLSAILYNQAGLPEQEERALRKALEFSPNNLGIRFRLAVVLDQLNRSDAAGDQIKIAMEQNPREVMRLIEQHGSEPGESN